MKKILLIALLICAPAARAAMPGCTTGGAPLYLQIPNYGASGTQFAAAVAYDMKYISTASLTFPMMVISTPTMSSASVLKWLNVGSSVTAAGGFYGSGAGLTALPAAQLTGAVPQASVNLSTVATALAAKADTASVIPSSATGYYPIYVASAAYAANGGGGGGVTTSTFTLEFHGGGDVFVASGTFVPNLGLSTVINRSTITITGVMCYVVTTSTVGATAFNVARSTDTGATATYSYLFSSPISIPANTKYSVWYTPDVNATYTTLPYALSLHTTSVPASGAMPTEYGCVIRYYRRLDL